MRQQDPVHCLYLIMSGEAEIRLTLSGTTRVVGSSRRGELLGEMSLLLEDQAGAAASVTSSGGMDLLAIERVRLMDALEQDPDLACRFHRGLACMLSQRSRDQLLSHRRALTSREAEANDPDRLNLDQLGRISRAARQFDWLCRHFQAGAAANR
jgi:CRP-like cAMP-binding protein